MNTSGFYKLDTEEGIILYAPNSVHAPTFTLLKEVAENKTGIYDGWQWFETAEEAYQSHNMTYIPPN